MTLQNVSRAFDSDFSLEISAGRVDGVAAGNVFGRNADIDLNITADVWDGGATAGVSLIWVAPTTARTHTIASTDINDTTGGTGARTVTLFGLASWDTPEVSEVVTLDTGSPPVTTTAFVIIHRMVATTWGALGPNLGTISATATTDATITAQILPSQGQTQMAIYGFPSTQTACMESVYASLDKSGGATGLADIDFCHNPSPDLDPGPFIVTQTFGLESSGTSYHQHKFGVLKIFSGPGIIKIQARSGANNMDVSAGFDFYLVDD